MSTRELIDAIYAGDATSIEAAFNQTMAVKVSEKLDDMRANVAQNMFASEEEVVEEEKKEPKIKPMGTHAADNQEDELDDEKLIRKMVKKSALKEDEEETEKKDSKHKPEWLVRAQKEAEKKEGKLKEEAEELEEKNWIAGAIKHPGAETAAAKKAGESTHEYAEKHKHAKGTAGKRARLALTLAKLNKKK